MHRSKIERLTDYVIGEAVAALLEQNAAISGASLAARLKTMAVMETDSDRKQALTLALAEIREEFPSARGVADAPPRSLSVQASAGAKKH
jgi:probable RcsB/C two-component-system connector